MIILVIIGFIVSIAGFLGCFLPIIPGPPLSYLAIIILSMAKNWEPFSATFLIITAILTVLLSLVDYIMPAMGAKRYGASRYGIWGSMIGMIAGLFVIPPFGMLILAFFGALAGEILAGKEAGKAMQAGLGIIMGNLVSVALKVSFSGVFLILYIFNMF